MDSLHDKRQNLISILKGMESILIAYSGGADSTFLVVMAHKVLGNKVLAVTANSPSLAPSELQEAISIASEFGFGHQIINTSELDDPNYRENGPKRCYFCKRELHTRLHELALELGFDYVASGTNIDDLSDFRPGLRATREFNVRNPLAEAKLGKTEIRRLSQEMGIPNWDKPAQACLSSRIPYGSIVTVEALKKIGRAEMVLRELGFTQFRVRHHDTIARIEVDPEELHLIFESQIRDAVITALRNLGYLYVTIDLAGYRQGSLNEGLRSKQRLT